MVRQHVLDDPVCLPEFTPVIDFSIPNWLAMEWKLSGVVSFQMATVMCFSGVRNGFLLMSCWLGCGASSVLMPMNVA